jgi:hypothetical protein
MNDAIRIRASLLSRRSIHVACACTAMLAFGGTGCAPADSVSEPIASSEGEKVELGSAALLFERLRTELPGRTGRYTFPTGFGTGVPALVQTYDEERGRISMIGRAEDSVDSEFILKVDERGLYGWLVDRERNLAWESTTGEDGDVHVEQVPVSKIFPECPVPPEDAPRHELPIEPRVLLNAATVYPKHVQSFPGDSVDVTKLESRPDSDKVWYIDLADVMNGSEPKPEHTKEDVWVAWSITAATLWQFDINVTTDPQVYEAAGVTNSGCVTMTYANIGGSSSCALNIFGTRRCCDNRLYRDGYATGRIINHESGHGLGLLHDGGSDGGEYFNGFSSFQWTPLMGNVWPGDRWEEALFQFSKGEYESATQTQDDFEIIDRTLDYVPDDIPDTKPLVLDGTTLSEENWGQIGRNTDTDSWTFAITESGGHATLTVDRIEHRGGSMLDVHASILDSTGELVAEANASVARHAELDVDLPMGSYVLVVKGGAEGTVARGFTSYSSVGLYAITGTLTGAASTGGTGGAGGMGGTAGMSGGAGTSGSAGSGGVAGSGGGGVGGVAGANVGGAGAGGTAGSAGTSGGASGMAGASGSGGASVGGGMSAGAGGVVTAGSGGAAGSAAAAGSFAGSGAGSTPVASGPAATEDSGCGCRMAPSESKQPFALSALVGAALVLARRRERNPHAQKRRQGIS